MAPSTDCRFFRANSKEKYGPEWDLYGGLLIILHLGEKNERKNISNSAKQSIIKRLRKDNVMFKRFCETCPNLANLEDIEAKYKIRINIWRQRSMKDALVLARPSTGNAEWSEVHFLSKKYSEDNNDLT